MSSKNGQRRQSDNSEDDGTNLPRGVQRVYMMEKDAGHRGPIVGAFLVDVFTDEQVVVIVTPSGVSVMTTEEGRSIAYRRPESGDAFTACAFIPISTKLDDNEILTKNCGLVLGTQEGRLELLEVSSSDLKVLHQCMEKTSSISAIERLRCVPSVVAVGTVDGRLLLWDPVVHPFTPTVSLRVRDEPAAIQCIASVGESEIWLSTTSNSVHVFSVAVDTSTKVRTVTCTAGSPTDVSLPISDMVESRSQNLLICLSSGSEIVLVDLATKKILHRYPARLMSCGAAVTSITAFDDDESTFIVLGGVEGSLCIRELNRRRKDNKLQCLLLRCFDKLVPERNDQVQIPEGCPVSSLSIATNDLCVVGDAACSVFVINMSLHQWRSAIEQGSSADDNEEEHVESREETREPSSEETAAESKGDVPKQPVVEPARQRSIELPIETRQLPRRDEPEQADAEIVESPSKQDPVKPEDLSPKYTVVSPKSNHSSKSRESHVSPNHIEERLMSPKSAKSESVGQGPGLPASDDVNGSPKSAASPERVSQESPRSSSPTSSHHGGSPKNVESPKNADSQRSADSPQSGISPKKVGSPLGAESPQSAVSPKKPDSQRSAASPQSVASPKKADSPRSVSSSLGSPKSEQSRQNPSSPKLAPQLEESFSEEDKGPETRKQSDL